MIHIACNIDANFIQHCAVTLVSLFENNKRADICVHIVAPYLSEADQAIFYATWLLLMAMKSAFTILRKICCNAFP